MGHWLDKHIKAQRHNRKILGKGICDLQELSERENWDRKLKRRKKY